jgi:hypothetical protein
MVQRKTRTGRDKIGVRVGRVINKYKVAKHFELTIEDQALAYRIRENQVKEEAALDGIYVLRTPLTRHQMGAADVVRSYKSLADVERAFRCMKTVDLKVRPIHHRLPDRVRAHIFLCMLAYYVEWHMREAWRGMLFADEDQAAKAKRDPVAPARRSREAERKAHTHRLSDGTPADSFRTLLEELSTIVRNTCRTVKAAAQAPTFTLVTQPNPIQQRALELLETITVQPDACMLKTCIYRGEMRPAGCRRWRTIRSGSCTAGNCRADRPAGAFFAREGKANRNYQRADLVARRHVHLLDLSDHVGTHKLARLDVRVRHVECGLSAAFADDLAELDHFLVKPRTSLVRYRIGAVALQDDHLEGLLDTQVAGCGEVLNVVVPQGRAPDSSPTCIAALFPATGRRRAQCAARSCADCRCSTCSCSRRTARASACRPAAAWPSFPARRTRGRRWKATRQPNGFSTETTCDLMITLRL